MVGNSKAELVSLWNGECQHTDNIYNLQCYLDL